MKKLTAFILVFILVTSMQLPVFAAQASLSDIKGHWAEQNIEAAAADGWVNGFPDGSFKPDVTITRAEFVKLLLAAIHLTPESNSAKFLIGSAAYNLNKETALTDMDNHWLTSQGWFLIAESFGLIVPADYSEASFDPNKAITRYEIAVIVDRAIGLVYPATQSSKTPDFSDAAQMPQWVQGYVNEAVSAGVFKGYPDGSFGGGRNATRAEAVIMVSRALTYMESGINKDITVSVREPASITDSQTVAVNLAAPAEEIGGVIYVPARSVFDAISTLYYNGTLQYSWSPVNQTLGFEYGQSYITFRSGDGTYSTNLTFTTEARLLNGELMIPAYNTSADNHFLQNLWSATWDQATKTVTIYVSPVKWGE